jgi:2,4-dienoyl-CoA reductase-like NADH-dependent reductase (Old Yellow Enzyme family)
MSILFEPIKLKHMELRNRFVRSATYDGSADRDGHVTETQIEILSRLADGGVGLIVTGITYVHPSGQVVLFQNSIASDDCIAGLKDLTAAVHHKGAKIAVQLFHAGREAGRLLEARNQRAAAPSMVPHDPYFSGNYRTMGEDEIWDIIKAFGQAARRAREAEFDALQIHGAHGYLPSQFLSPFTNIREDGWGGSVENRLRFHREIYREIRSKVGQDYPVFIKIGVQDGIPGGLQFSEGKRAAQLLSQCGFDALEVSLGLRGASYEETEFRTKIKNIDREAYFRPWCREIKSLVDTTIMMVGGLRTFGLMDEIIQKGEADLISLCRPLIREPGIINEWKAGVRHRATCVSCNKCLEALRSGETLHCILKEDEEAQKKEDREPK